MFDLDNIVDMLIDNSKKLFFPSEWINLDIKFSKIEIFTLLFLDKNKEATMTELVEYINSPMSTATGIIDRLVRNGYIDRGRSETDRRIVVLKLTDAGSELITNFKNLISSYLKMVIDELTEEEQQFLINIVFKIINKLQSQISDTKDDNNKTTIKKINIE
ncbi:MarR family transcriptional regulator [Clostridium sp. YIM B02515]|uniref:MarR family transcriptional regulator n=1 Tax=Clostridium rhizosphaerae TaxID=2803861 RepID=A0ABS1T574_9CLOT|nr:MarR family transcriptional regulator [Clostridium rhizosphaerae]MBL4934488.1 MarR family transcriptional regulator [Clostridium rhizosphaerae]